MINLNSSERYNNQLNTPLTSRVDGRSFSERISSIEVVDLREPRESVSPTQTPVVGESFLSEVETGRVRQRSTPERSSGTFFDEIDTGQIPSVQSEFPTVGTGTSTEPNTDDPTPTIKYELRSRILDTMSGEGNSKIPNPLRDLNSHNYVITLGLLKTLDLLDPQQYRSTGNFEYVIARTSGGSLTNRWQTASELDAGGHAEYYIEDLEVDGVLGPNPNTGVTVGTSVSFTVTEPYSMGNFTQAIVGAARSQNYESYNKCPFCIKIDFVGWDEYGNIQKNEVTSPAYIPIIIINMEISVKGSGAEYSVTAVPLSELALSDHINRVHTTVNSSGSKVHQVLTTGETSITNVLNQRIEEIESVDAPKGDRYVICFPTNPDEVGEVVKRSPDSDQQGDIEIGSGRSTYDLLMEYATDESQMNDIGRSAVVDSHNHGGDQPSPIDGYYDAETDSMKYLNPSLERNFQFLQTQSITEAIKSVILQSKYAEETASQRSDDGLSEWFRIVVNTYVERNPDTETRLGRSPMIYVYSVIPYYADEAKNLPVNESPKNTQKLKDLALKSYQYIYTGKNEDVLDFDINFKFAYLQSIMSNLGQNTGPNAAGMANVATGDQKSATGSEVSETESSEEKELHGSVKEETDLQPNTMETRNVGIQYGIAAMFHDNIVNKVVDMVNAEMTIWGDPFFIPQQTGNWAGTLDSTVAGMTSNGSADYLRGEVLVTMDFKTYLDYSESTGMMQFESTIPQFSGLFMVWGATSTFSGGEFKQVLKMVRRTGQTEPETSGSATTLSQSAKSITDLGEIYASLAESAGNVLPPGIFGNLASLSNLYDPTNFSNAVEATTGTGPIAPTIEIDGTLFATSVGVFPSRGA